MSEERNGFEIRGRFYPWFQEMGLNDPILVAEVCGVEYNEFVAAWGRVMGEASSAPPGEEIEMDPVVLNGLIAVSFWQQHRDWGRGRVVKFIQGLLQSEIEIVGEGADASPPVVGASSDSAISDAPSEKPSPSRKISNDSPASPDSPGSSSEAATPVSTGHLPSVTGSPV